MFNLRKNKYRQWEGVWQSGNYWWENALAWGLLFGCYCCTNGYESNADEKENEKRERNETETENQNGPTER